MQAARELGCELLVTDCEFGAASQRNLPRASFQLAYANAIMILPATAD